LQHYLPKSLALQDRVIFNVEQIGEHSQSMCHLLLHFYVDNMLLDVLHTSIINHRINLPLEISERGSAKTQAGDR
jgi:hypothetical protein